jgi:hypothetical protein
MLKRIIFTLLSFVILSVSVFTPVAHAQVGPGPWYDQGLYDWYAKVYDPNISSEEQIFGERYTAAQVDWIIWSLLTWPVTKLIGPEGVSCVLKLIATKTLDISGCAGALITEVDEEATLRPPPDNESLASKVFADRPFSGVTYFKNAARKLKLVPEAQAQGFGFAGALDPFVEMWRIVRDLSYGVFVIATIIMAFMIMFRFKISPQTVISLQSAIPKLFIALLLVTFSYAIAGLFVDLMYVAIGIVSLVGAQFFNTLADGPLNPGLLPPLVFDFLTTGVANGGISTILLLYLVMSIIALFFVLFMMVGLGFSILSGIVVIGLSMITGGIFLLIALALLLILFIIGTIVVMWMSIKLLFTLVKAFAHIILLTIFAPFYIVAGLFIPSLGFGKWARQLIANLAVFVVATTLIMLAYIFIFIAIEISLAPLKAGIGLLFLNVALGSTFTSILTGSGTTPGWPPLLTGVGEGHLALLMLVISFALFFMIPKAADLVKSVITGRPFGFGSAIGESLSPITMAGGAGAQYLSTAQQSRYKDAEAALKYKGTAIPGREQALHAAAEALRKLSGGRVK